MIALLLCWLGLLACPALGPAVHLPPPTAVLDIYPDARLRAIFDVESDSGKNCETSHAGAETCWQIKPNTAKWAGCSADWRTQPVICARLVRHKGMSLCRRWDATGEFRFWFKGYCAPPRFKPSVTTQRALRRLPRYLLEIKHVRA